MLNTSLSHWGNCVAVRATLHLLRTTTGHQQRDAVVVPRAHNEQATLQSLLIVHNLNKTLCVYLVLCKTGELHGTQGFLNSS
jgi:hypothetical protein